uniref:Uncharacterized protein n=1 Tax=Myoviridae sp. ct3pM2 TaxID=2827658 RepID=A0A8S5TF99_9CAUD|nr:MAG TPA: hypothetical protein [Myoviridae sp. ct3pM2]
MIFNKLHIRIVHHYYTWLGEYKGRSQDLPLYLK